MHYRNEIERFKKRMQEDARRQLDREFGPSESSRIVDMVLRHAEEQHQLQLELAPDELMPASVLYFLRQVRAQLWDGCAFPLNEPHIMVASPINKMVAFQKFTGVQALNIPFQEYSASYPHKKYTLGFGGRPGGVPRDARSQRGERRLGCVG